MFGGREETPLIIENLGKIPKIPPGRPENSTLAGVAIPFRGLFGPEEAFQVPELFYRDLAVPARLVQELLGHVLGLRAGVAQEIPYPSFIFTCGCDIAAAWHGFTGTEGYG
jgi:hypothetical protein